MAAAGVARKSRLVLVGTGAVVAYIGTAAVLPGSRDATVLCLEPRAGTVVKKKPKKLNKNTHLGLLFAPVPVVTAQPSPPRPFKT